MPWVRCGQRLIAVGLTVEEVDALMVDNLAVVSIDIVTISVTTRLVRLDGYSFGVNLLTSEAEAPTFTLQCFTFHTSYSLIYFTLYPYCHQSANLSSV